MQNFDRLLRGKAGRDQLSSAGESKHQVWLDEAERDAEIRGDEAFVNVNRCTCRRRAEEAVLRQIAGIVIEDRIAGGDRGAEDFLDFRLGRRPMESGGDQNPRVLNRNPGRRECRQNRR